MQFQTVFDIHKTGYSEWWFPGLGLIFLIVGGLFVMGRQWLGPKSLQSIPRLLIGFGAIWTVLALLFTLSPHLRLSAALRRGHCVVTEGVVTEYQPMPPTGHGFESFVVSGKRFDYSDYVLSAGFHKTALRGSPIREGVYVRIHHVGNEIARLEIAARREG